MKPSKELLQSVDVSKGLSLLDEFRAFITRGNVVDLAIGVIMGTAFGAIVTSLVNDIIMPPIGYVLGRVSFNDLFWVIGGTTYPSLDAARKAGAPVIAYGAFIQVVLNFLIISGAVFLIVKVVNQLYRKQEAAPAAPSKSEELLTEIRDLLKNQASQGGSRAHNS